MALKKPRIANSPMIEENGYATGVIADIKYLEDGESEYEGEQYEFTVTTQGSQKDINLKIWTGVVLNSNQFSNGNGKPEYNKFTRLCLSLGLLSVEELKTADLDKLGEKLDGLKGQKVRFKLTTSPKDRGLSRIDLSTLQLIKE